MTCPIGRWIATSLPLFDHGQLRKRWRYVGLFAEELMLCAARAEVGPLTQSLLGALGPGDAAAVGAHGAASRQPRGDAGRAAAGDRRAGPARQPRARRAPRRSRPPAPAARAWAWTRKRAGMPVEGTVEMPGRRWQVAGRGVDDESAGHHQRHTSWLWSAGRRRPRSRAATSPGTWSRGSTTRRRAASGRSGSTASPTEPPPVRFRGLDGIDLGDAGSLDFAAESEHARDDNYLLSAPATATASAASPAPSAASRSPQGLGVMEEHDARW